MIEITMPRLSDTMEEGAIAAWLKHPGDAVEIGDTLVEIETDKATMEYEAYESGTLAKILVQEGENVAIGTPIALLDDGTGHQPAPTQEVSGGKEQPPPSTAVPPDSAQVPDMRTEPSGATRAGDERAPAAARPTGPTQPERPFASPLVRKLTREHHLDISAVHGSGPGGRIVRQDIQPLLDREAIGGAADATTAPSSPLPAAPPAASAVRPPPDDRRGSEAVPISRVRRVIARRLAESARTIPHFFVTAGADAESFMQLRGELNSRLVAAGRPKISVNDLLIRACALALRQHPGVNVSYGDDGDTLLLHHRVNIGVAVAAENGLVVPVIDDADQKTVTQLGSEARELVALANAGRLAPAQMSGGTFTISNLGMFGVEQFTAIINPPECAILAVGATAREASVVGDTTVPRYRMRYTLSADHRAIDGALAAQFLQTLTGLIEEPWTILA
jgi:pyruvate dehydrogenase E2 component (dihydrolipoamide acetyltransferase)